MSKRFFLILTSCMSMAVHAQLFVARDTISVLENGYNLKMPWANGLNFSNVSNADLNGDGRKDLVVFDRINLFGVGRFRCFIHSGLAGQATYTSNPDHSYYFPQVANWAILSDYNCDGKADIFCSTSAGIMVYRNTSVPPAISFTLAKSLLYSNFQPAIGNLYAGANAVPGVADIDGDGDLDILTYSPQGVFIEYHKNMSKENYNHCDSLVYELATGCWGKMIENNCSIDLNQTCAFKPVNTNLNPKEPLHAGSCLTCIDSDNDGDKDLLLGDISCNITQYAHNNGSGTLAIMSDTTKNYPNFPSKANTQVIRINNFPCTYVVDANGDNKPDLIASPNANGSENTQCIWYYQNASPTATVDFQFVKRNFLQDEMIEVGQNSFPVLLDYDSDGKKDLLIGTGGYYENNGLRSKLTLYRNIGTLSQPAFSLITRDYASVSNYSLNTIAPAVGDIDGDGDIDLLLGTQNGIVHWLENTAGAGNPCAFTVFKNNPFSFIAPSAAAAPQLFDIDKDGKLDLMLGLKNGRICYYRNIGTVTSPAFTLTNNFFGGVDVKAEPTLYGLDGYASPYFFDEGGSTKLIVGSVNGKIYYYSVPSATSSCVLITQSMNGIQEGGQSTVYFEDINNDGKRDLFVGNGSGGLSFFSSKGPGVGIKENAKAAGTLVTVYPNPARDYITVHVKETEVLTGEITVYDLLGSEKKKIRMNNNEQTFSIQDLASGVYFINVRINEAQMLQTFKFVIE